MGNSNRRDELLKLKSYTEEIDNELTLILQTLQWDRNHLLQNPLMVMCRYDCNHKVPPDRAAEHEKECFLRKNGYSKDDQLLPDPLDSESNTLVKLGKDNIQQIIADASKSDSTFRRGVGCHGAEPMSLERLQVSYSADERRAIHDAVVSAVPSCHDLTDLMLPTTSEDKNEKVILSRNEILLELRNMRRRRTKYRVAAKSRNYSDVLRDVIKTQMEHFNDGKTTTEDVDEENNHREAEPDGRDSRQTSQEGDKYTQDRYKKFVPRPIKIEVNTDGGSTERIRDYSRDRSDGANRYEMENNRDRSARDNERRRHEDRSRDRRNDDHMDRDHRFGDSSRKRRYDDDYRDDTRERSSYYEGSKEKNKDKDYRSDKRSRRRYENEDGDYQVGQDDRDTYEKPRERRSDEKRDKKHMHKDIYHNDKRHKDRERSRDRRSDHRYEDRSERIHIKQERDDSRTRDDKTKYDRSDKNYDRRYNKAYRDKNCDGHSSEMDQEKFSRYYDVPSREIYDPNKVIKQEK
ncbi:U11/U12 small nuclear ribonucleoprotein 48 kDa protein [Helicoverpa armigera]|uniref:U11/U12 small nuclear ribonucleoprotein 48 kDa protein n=1 Tax=Helicoverpa armigera TaxID=29058 RepID=UPI003083C359